MPKPYASLWDAWKEIVPAVLRQVRDPAHYVRRKLPDPKPRVAERNWSSEVKPDGEGWLEVCAATDLGRSDVIRFDYRRKTFALYRDHEGKLYATDGVCTHGNTHLADGLVKDRQIECPGLTTAASTSSGRLPARPPICRGLATPIPSEERGGRLWLNVIPAPAAPGARRKRTYSCASPARAALPHSLRKSRSRTDRHLHLLRAGRLHPGQHPRLYGEIRFRNFDILRPLRRSVGTPACLRPCLKKPRRRTPAQQLLHRQQRH